MNKPKTYKEIILTKGKIALVSIDDFEMVNAKKWLYRESGKTNGKNGYAQRTEKGVSMFMHNIIIAPVNGLVIDHINHNGLDNRRENLRLVTIQQNYHNFPRKGKMKYRGVHYRDKRKNTKPWEVILRYDKKIVFDKTFATEDEAALAYNEQAIKYYGDVAQLNIIK